MAKSNSGKGSSGKGAKPVVQPAAQPAAKVAEEKPDAAEQKPAETGGLDDSALTEEGSGESGVGSGEETQDLSQSSALGTQHSEEGSESGVGSGEGAEDLTQHAAPGTQSSTQAPAAEAGNVAESPELALAKAELAQAEAELDRRSVLRGRLYELIDELSSLDEPALDVRLYQARERVRELTPVAAAAADPVQRLAEIQQELDAMPEDPEAIRLAIGARRAGLTEVEEHLLQIIEHDKGRCESAIELAREEEKRIDARRKAIIREREAIAASLL